MGKQNPKEIARTNRIQRVRKKISGNADRPRLRVFKSAKHIYAQIIDDTAKHTMIAMSTVNRMFSNEENASGKIAEAHKCGLILAKLAKEKGIQKVVFDRGGYLYHGRVKALSEGAREGGLDF